MMNQISNTKRQIPTNKQLYSSGRVRGLTEMSRHKIMRIPAWSIRVTWSRQNSKPHTNLNSTSIDSSEWRSAKFGSKILKQCLKITNAPKLKLKNLHLLNSKNSDVKNGAHLSFINKRTIHVIPPKSIQDYQNFESERLNKEMINVLHAITPISDRINFN